MGNRMQVIGVTGYATTGKDLAVSFLAEHHFVRVSFADAIRESLLALNPYVPNWYEGKWNWDDFCPLEQVVAAHGWDKAKQSIEVRRLLQRMGTEAGRDIHGQDCWCKIATNKAIKAINEKKSVAFSDLRFSNELEVLNHLSLLFDIPTKLIRIERPGVGPVNNHISDKMDFLADATILNDGDVEQFRQRVLEAVLG